MKYRRFGKTGLSVSVFSLGTMRFDSAAIAVLTVVKAVAQGINHIETAPAYGVSERYVGEALATLAKAKVPVSRSQLVITSKLSPNLSADEVERAIDSSLERLGTDYLDCLAIHGINTAEHLGQVRAQSLPGLERVRADGRVRHVGFSTHGPLDVILSAIDSEVFAFVNLHYNYFFQRNLSAIARVHARDMGLFIISPADKAGMLYTPPEQLKQLCAPYAPLLLNYRWLLSDPRITTLSLGPASPDELDWPLQVADLDGKLTAGEQSVIDQLDQAQTEKLGTDLCSQCHACLPCPETINIPEVLRLRNLAVAYDMKTFGEYRYGMFENAGHWFPGRRGNRCTDCGDCLPRCPEQLNIPDLLRDTHQRLSGKQRRRLWGD